MGNSLQEQLLKTGLVDAKQAKKANAGKPRRSKRKGPAEPDAAAAAAQRANADMVARDRALNAERKAAAERAALVAQVRQLIEQNRESIEGGDEPYHFVDGGKVRTLQVTAALRQQLAKGRLDVVKLDGRYDLVPAAVAEKIGGRDPECVVARPQTDAEPATDDPYADYQVPDDLIW